MKIIKRIPYLLLLVQLGFAPALVGAQPVTKGITHSATAQVLNKIPMQAPAPNLQQKRLTFLHTNDMHGSYQPFKVVAGNATAQTGDGNRDNLLQFEKEGMIGGFAYLAAAIKTIRVKKGPDQVLLLDGGDTFSDNLLGNLTQGTAMISLMNKVGYDLMALGNHDFDYGLARTRELQDLARFPMRAANILDKKTGQPLFGAPYEIKEKNGLRIGLLALGYRNTPQTGNPANVAGLQFITGLEAAQRYVPELIKQVDLVVVLSHEGSKVDELIAQQVPGIHLIIGAHSHDLISPPKKINQTYLVQAMSDAAVLGETEVILENKKVQQVVVHYHKLWHDQWVPEPQIQQEIKKLEAPYQEILIEKIGDNPTLLGRQYKSESPFDKWVGNLMIAATKSQVALLPGVGYGISLPPGPVTKAQIYNLLPHPSKLVTLSMTGKQLLQTLEQSAQNQKPANSLEAVGGLIQTAGIRYIMDLRQPIGKRISQVFIASQPLQAGQDYKVVTHSGMVSGIHQYREIGQGKQIKRMETGLTEFVIEQLQGEKTIKMPVNMGEVKVIKADK